MCTSVLQSTRDRVLAVSLGVRASGIFQAKLGKAHGRVWHCTGVWLPSPSSSRVSHTRACGIGESTRVYVLGHTGVCLGFQTHTGSMHGRVPCRIKATQACITGARSCARPRFYRTCLEIQKFPHQPFHTPNQHTYKLNTTTSMPIIIISSSQTLHISYIKHISFEKQYIRM